MSLFSIRDDHCNQASYQNSKNAGTLNFCGDIMHWDRFDIYAPFVRYLTIIASTNRYADSAMTSIAWLRPSLSNYLLPKLQSLVIDCREDSKYFRGFILDLASLCLSSEVASLSIITDGLPVRSLSREDVLELHPFFDMVPHRAKGLQRLKLLYHDNSNKCMGSHTPSKKLITDVLRTLPRFKSVEICPLNMDSELARKLSGVENLHMRCRQHSLALGALANDATPGTTKKVKKADEQNVRMFLLQCFHWTDDAPYCF